MIEGPLDNLFDDNEFEIEFVILSDLYISEKGKTYEIRRRSTNRYENKPLSEIFHEGERYTILKRRVFSVVTHMSLEEEYTYLDKYTSNKINL